MTVPFADPVVVALIQGLDVVGTRVRSAEIPAPLPAVRATLVYDRGMAKTWEREPIFQIEVWADDPFEAGTIATEIANRWPTLGRVNVAGAYVAGCWVESHPRPIGTTDSDAYRYLMEVGLRILRETP